MEYCPDCILPLQKQSKKLGCFSVWLVCPECGYRQRETSSFYLQKELDTFNETMKRINKNSHKHYSEKQLKNI